MMTEYHTKKRIDNTRLTRCAAPSRVRDLWKLCGAGTALASCLLFYAWQHFECIQVTYRVEELKAERAKAAELNQQLHLEVAALRSPMRVDAIARQQLGLTVPVPGQLAPADGTSDAVLADAREAIQTPRP